MLTGVITKFRWDIQNLCYKQGDIYLTKIDNIIETQMPPIVKYLGDKKFLIGDDPVWLDFFMLELLNLIMFIDKKQGDDGMLFEENPTLKHYH